MKINATYKEIKLDIDVQPEEIKEFLVHERWLIENQKLVRDFTYDQLTFLKMIVEYLNKKVKNDQGTH